MVELAVNRLGYISMMLAGLVIAFLAGAIDGNIELANTVILLTTMITGGIYLLLEYRFYRRHNALLASLQFILIPILILILGNILAPQGWGGTWISFSISLGVSIAASSTLTSFLLIVPIVILTQLFNRYYDGRYPGFVIQRSQHHPKRLPFLFHMLTIAGIIVSASILGRMDMMGLGFIVGSIVQIFQKFIRPLFRGQSTRDWESNNRPRWGRNRRRSLPSGSSRPAVQSRSRSQSSNSTSSPRSRSRSSISTTPSNGYREVPVRSRNPSGRTTNETRREPSSRARSPSASIDQGIDVVTSSKTRKVKASKLKNFVPQGHVDQTDLKCMVCYEEFNKDSVQNIVICPSCKFPAHEVEFKSWLNSSSLCPRCNKKVAKNKLDAGTVSEAQYANLVKTI